MGDFGPRFLSALAGNMTGQAPSPVGVVPPEAGGEVNPGMRMFGITPDMLPPAGSVPGIGGGMFGGEGQGPTERWDPPQVAGGMGPEAEAVVRGFKPKKISFWGALGDQLLKHWGNDPAFSKRIDNINMQRAMEGFTNDPMEMVRRMSQIPGMQGKALELWDKIEDNQRAKALQESTVMTRREKIINSASRLFGPQSLAPDGSNYKTIRDLFMNIMERNKITDVYLPEEYDPNVINAQIAGDWTLNQQDMARYRPREQARKEANTASQIERRSVQNAQGDRRLNIQQQNADRPRTGGRTSSKPEYSGRTIRIKDSGGTERVVEFSKDGKTAYQELPDGRIIKYDVRGPRLVRVDVK